MARSNEPAVWSLFAAGGALTALVLPIHVLLFVFLVPFGVLAGDPDALLAFLRHPLFRLYAFVLCCLGLVHAAHRLRFTLVDLGLHGLAVPIAWICYLGAVLGTVVALYAVIVL